MKKLGKLKLNQLRDSNLSNEEMTALIGGTTCTCSCLYANYGGSTSSDNSQANYNKGGYTSVGGYNNVVTDDYGTSVELNPVEVYGEKP